MVSRWLNHDIILARLISKIHNELIHHVKRGRVPQTVAKRLSKGRQKVIKRLYFQKVTNISSKGRQKVIKRSYFQKVVKRSSKGCQKVDKMLSKCCHNNDCCHVSFSKGFSNLQTCSEYDDVVHTLI